MIQKEETTKNRINKIKSHKGISLTSLMIAVIVMLLIAGTLIVTGVNGGKIKALNKLYNDIEQLQDKVSNYQAKYGGMPLLQPYTNTNMITENEKVKNPNDGETYYVIDLGAMENLSLNYGKDFEKIKGVSGKDTTYTDVYIINEQSGAVYYPKGIELDKVKYYREKEESSKIAVVQKIANGEWTGSVNSPKIDGTGLTGVYWDESGKEVAVTNDNKDQWYDYGNQKWANAKSKDGSYWVWIPRYEYKIDSVNQKIAVKFVPTTQTTKDADYDHVHPAFTNNVDNGGWDKEIPGFWVAKYEAGFQANTTDESGSVTNGSDTVEYSDKSYTSNNSSYLTNALGQNLSDYANQKLSYPVFKPLTYTYNNISTGDCYTISRQIQEASFYGLSKVDSHMQKNSEWGAVAYLTHSSYGRDGVEITTNSKNLNNLNSKYIYAVTGYANSTPNGVSASSTNNRTGVFDLSGGAWEYTSGYIVNGDWSLKMYGASYTYEGNTMIGKSTKYATVYPYNTSSDSNTNNYNAYKAKKTENYGYGDGILETSTTGSGANSWNSDHSYFPYTSYPFFLRGGYYGDGSYAGVSAFHYRTGDSHYWPGFRATLIVE